MTITVEQPADVRVYTVDGFASLTWRRDFSPSWTGRFVNARRSVGRDILEFSEPYIPRLTGRLIASGKVNEEDGSVTWTAPYARAQYYLPNRRKSVGTRGSFWVERMKEAHLRKIVDNARKAFNE